MPVVSAQGQQPHDRCARRATPSCRAPREYVLAVDVGLAGSGGWRAGTGQCYRSVVGGPDRFVRSCGERWWFGYRRFTALTHGQKESALRRIISVALPGVLTLALASVAGPAQAAGDAPDTPCQAEIFVNLDPGVSLQPSSGSFASNGQDGHVACTGDIDGRHSVAGGTGGAVGRYGVDAPNSCYQLKGTAVFTLTALLPTDTKPINFKDVVKGEYGPLENNWFFVAASRANAATARSSSPRSTPTVWCARSSACS